MAFPTRYVKLDAARLVHGERVDRFGAFLSQGDPLADAAVDAMAALPRDARDSLVDRCLSLGIAHVPEAPAALVSLFAQLEHVPLWVDPARLDRGGRAFLRSGILGGIVLGAGSLIVGYCSPAGNKPLALSGRFATDGARRLAETSRFVQAISLPGGLRRGADGFRAMVKVRLMHASIRRWLVHSPQWKADDWGAPINQVDMAGTVLLFSLVVLDSLRKLGYRTSAREREDFLHLWRYGAYLLGVDPELHCASEAEARSLWDLLTSTQGYPDEDSIALARSVLDVHDETIGNAAAGTDQARAARERAARVKATGYAISRHLLGDDYADRLRYPKTRITALVKVFGAVNAGVGPLLRVLPRVPFGTWNAGVRYWNFVVKTTLADRPATFAMPDAPTSRQSTGEPVASESAYG